MSSDQSGVLSAATEVHSLVQSWIRLEELHVVKWCMQKEGRRAAACTPDCVVRVAEDFATTVSKCPEGVTKQYRVK